MTEFVILTDVFALGYSKSAGAHRLATVLRNHGVDVQVIDLAARMDKDQLHEVMLKFIDADTKFVGISNTFLNVRFEHSLFPNNYSLELLNDFKTVYDFKVILGGNRNGTTSVIENDYLNCIDLIVTGFADKAMLDIYDNYDTLVTEEEDGYKILHADKMPYTFNDFHNSEIVWQDSDIIFPDEALPIEIARGCIFRCAFCFFPMNGAGHSRKYMRSEENIKRELMRNYDQFGITKYDIMDDLLNDSVEKCEMLHRIFTSLPFDIKWTGYARHDLMISHPHTLDLFNESGCTALRFGIETLNHESGKAIGKGMEPQKTKNGLRWMRENSDIGLGGSFIAGLPHETKDSLKSMCDWLEDPDCPLHQKQLIVLSIPRVEGRENKSKLMIDPDKHGYTDLNPDNKSSVEWHNGHFDIYYAKEVYNNIWPILKKHSTYISHDAYRLHNIGFDFDQVHKAVMGDVVYSNIDKLFNPFKDKFVDRILSINTDTSRLEPACP